MEYIGLMMVAMPFIILFILMVRDIGLLQAFAGVLMILGLMAWLTFAVYLMDT